MDPDQYILTYPLRLCTLLRSLEFGFRPNVDPNSGLCVRWALDSGQELPKGHHSQILGCGVLKRYALCLTMKNCPTVSADCEQWCDHPGCHLALPAQQT